MLSGIPIVHMPPTEFSIDGCEEAIIWTTTTKQDVLAAIRNDKTLAIYTNDDDGPRWIRGQMIYESTVIDVGDNDDINNVASARGSTDFISGIPSNVKSILIILSHMRGA
jgi:hypothetical protein